MVSSLPPSSRWGRRSVGLGGRTQRRADLFGLRGRNGLRVLRTPARSFGAGGGSRVLLALLLSLGRRAPRRRPPGRRSQATLGRRCRSPQAACRPSSQAPPVDRRRASDWPGFTVSCWPSKMKSRLRMPLIFSSSLFGQADFPGDIRRANRRAARRRCRSARAAAGRRRTQAAEAARLDRSGGLCGAHDWDRTSASAAARALRRRRECSPAARAGRASVQGAASRWFACDSATASASGVTPYCSATLAIVSPLRTR